MGRKILKGGVLLLMAALIQLSFAYMAYGSDDKLTITGNGVETTVEYTQGELKAMYADTVRHIYSSVNNWPTKKLTVAEGIPLSTLLKKAGLKEAAATIKVYASDGYYKTFTRQELTGDARYAYPNIADDSTTDNQKVETIIAWTSGDGKNGYDGMSDDYLLLVMGQRSITEQNAPWFVKYVSKIEVTLNKPDKWAEATVETVQESPEGSIVKLNHPDFDSVKLHYTKDGTVPTVNSPIFNISATHWQPEINEPVSVKKGEVLKVTAIGPGKENSDVLTYEPKGVQGSAFGDMKGYEWAEESVMFLSERKILEGTKAGIFNPGGKLTRAQFAKIMVVAAGEEPAASIKGSFDDVKQNAWYAGYVEKAVELKLISGKGDGKFAPDDTITKEQMISIVVRAMEKEKEAGKLKLSDAAKLDGGSSVSPWAEGFVAYAYRAGLLEKGHMLSSAASGKWNLTGGAAATRAEAADIVYRMLSKQ